MYVPNIKAPKYIKQLLIHLKGETDSNTVIVGDFNTPLTAMDRSFRQKVNKEIVAFNETLDQMGLIDLYRTCHPNAPEYTFFSSAHGTLLRTDHMLGYKTSLNKFKKTETISNIFSDHKWYDTRNQLQKESWKNHKYVETKKHATEQLLGQ